MRRGPTTEPLVARWTSLSAVGSMVDGIKRSAQQCPTPEFERRGGIDAVGVVDYVHDLRGGCDELLEQRPCFGQLARLGGHQRDGVDGEDLHLEILVGPRFCQCLLEGVRHDAQAWAGVLGNSNPVSRLVVAAREVGDAGVR